MSNQTTSHAKLRAAINALQNGYAASKSLFDDDMICHAETICGEHIDELAKLWPADKVNEVPKAEVESERMVEIPVVVGVYDHKHGTDVSVHASDDDATAAFVHIALEYWKDRADNSAPEDPRSESWTDQQILDAYFDGNEEEFKETSTHHLRMTAGELQNLLNQRGK